MTSALHALTALTTLLCAVLLLRAYANVRKRLLLWSGLCFLGLTIATLFVLFDLVVFPQKDLYTYRVGIAAISMLLLIYGLIWESE